MWWQKILWCAFCIYVAKEKNMQTRWGFSTQCTIWGTITCLHHAHSLITSLCTVQ